MAQPTRFSTVSIGFPVGSGAAPPDIAVLSVGSTDMAGIKRIFSQLTSVDVGSVDTDVTSSTTVAVPGVEVGDCVIANPGSTWSGDFNFINVQALCEEADGVVTLLLSNHSMLAINPSASTWRFTGFAF
ncbi:hypothetical protein LCGC14_2190250 [marine sediment metagenome]|uniref:Uncharacterized protein n=1 Tax=marine sediment metagenome TaxID=412755 RepID=A0A0F9DJS4_9ZZZZ